MKRYLVALLLGIVLNQSLVAVAATSFEETQAWAKTQNTQTLDRMKKYNPNAYFNNYTENPKEAQYYEGVTQSNTNKLEQATQIGLQSENAKNVNESINNRPQYQINFQSEMIRNGVLVQNEAENVVRGVESQYVTCQSKPNCEVTYTSASCEKSKFSERETCSSHLIVNAMPVENSFQTVTALVQGMPNKKAQRITLFLDLVKAVVINHNGREASLIVQGKPPLESCPDVIVEFNSITNNYPKNKFDAEILTQPSCANGFNLILQLTSKSGEGRPMHAGLNYSIRAKQNPIIQESWTNQCDYFNTLQSAGVCQLEKEECTEGALSKEINGVRVERSCWAKKRIFRCNTGGIVDTCALGKNTEYANTG